MPEISSNNPEQPERRQDTHQTPHIPTAAERKTADNEIPAIRTAQELTQKQGGKAPDTPFPGDSAEDGSPGTTPPKTQETHPKYRGKTQNRQVTGRPRR